MRSGSLYGFGVGVVAQDALGQSVQSCHISLAVRVHRRGKLMLPLEVHGNGLRRLKRLGQWREDTAVGGVATNESHAWMPSAQVVMIRTGKFYRLGRMRAAAALGWAAEWVYTTSWPS
jgi:hypothetical protein